jgi:hypothetical protein
MVTNLIRILQIKAFRFNAIVGLGFLVLITLLIQSWGKLVGVAIIILLSSWMSPTEQKYYFTFGSFRQHQIFFKLRLS